MYPKLHLIYCILFLLVILEFYTVTAQLTHGDEVTKLGWNIRCRLQPISYDCSNNTHREYKFYYDLTMQACKTYYHGNCLHSYNSFMSLMDCSRSCLEPGQEGINEPIGMGVSCRMQPDFGTCNNYYPMWYFDASERTCKGFSYSGCGGNGNRFTTAQNCYAVCSAAVPVPQGEK